MRDDTVEVCRQLARQCSDASAIEAFINLLFDVFFGSDGKLTATTHKISVLQVSFPPLWSSLLSPHVSSLITIY